jgi:uncharacterized protein YjiS (DUF1127 family)
MPENSRTITYHQDAFRAPNILGAIKRCWMAYRRHRDARRAIAILRSMDDRLLKDIGITRGDILCVVVTGAAPDRRSSDVS